MNAEILMIGTELLLGQIQDTNATYLAQMLAENGVNLYQKTTVGDNRERIVAALAGALERSDVVVCSGGLGPTEDDITRDCVGDVFERPLEYRDKLFQEIAARFAHVQIRITENNKKQAMLPQGSKAIDNPHGTAPGILAEDGRGMVICLPGVPSELKLMMERTVMPLPRERSGAQGVLHYRVLKVCGLGESRVDSLMGDLINAQQNPTVGLLASPDAVRIRIAAHAENIEAADALIDPVEVAICERLPGLVLGRDDDTLESVVDGLLTERGWTLAVAETHSGGTVAQRLSAAKAKSFLGGSVLPPGHHAYRSPFDLIGDILLRFPANCALALSSDVENRRTNAAFRSPDGDAEWEIGFYGANPRNQVRTAVIALERVRRILEGISGDA